MPFYVLRKPFSHILGTVGIIVIDVKGLMMSHYGIIIHTTFPRLIYIYVYMYIKKRCM